MKRILLPVLTGLLALTGIKAGAQVSQNVQQLFHWQDNTLPGSALYNNTYNEVWGTAINNREFAIIGSTMGTHIFDVTTPATATLAAFIPGAAQGPSIIHRDYKIYRNYLYAVSDEGRSTLQIIDMSQLPTAAPVVYNTDSLIVNSHNIYIDTAKAKLYACSVRKRISPNQFSNVGLQVYSLANPVRPQLLAEYNSAGTVHDAFVRNDTAYLNAGFLGLQVVNFSNPASPQLIGQLTQYPFKGYNHSGWLTANGQYYVFADENHGAEIKVCDVSTPGTFQISSTFTSGVSSNSIPHNQLIKGNYVYVSYYYDGLQIFDISNPLSPVKTGFYDTYPGANGISYEGAWGVYPFLPSGNVLVSDMQTGLYVFDVSAAITGKKEHLSSLPMSVYPNPFSSQLTIRLPENVHQPADVVLTDMLGRTVYTGKLNPEQQVVQPDNQIPPGMYQLQVKAGNEIWIKRVIKQ